MKSIWMHLALIVLIFASCKKTNNELTVSDNHSPQGISVNSGRMNFSSKAAYSRYLEAPDKQGMLRAVTTGSEFTSYTNRGAGSATQQSRMINGCDVPESLVENNPVFFDMLNAEGVVEIDGILYRYDYCNDKVWVISAADAQIPANYAAFMSGADVTDVVGSFPTYVDVLEATALGHKTMPPATDTDVDESEIFDRGARGINFSEWCNINNDEKYPKNQNVKMDGIISYDKFAIYFHFYAIEKYKTPCTFFNWCTSSGGRRDWNVTYGSYYRVKGSNSPVNITGTLTPPPSGENKCSKTFYEGTRGLRDDLNHARWNVNNMFTNKLSVERAINGTFFNYSRYMSNFGFVNNYQFDQGTIYYQIYF